jgi:tRNA/tmRNA/rRNA uracil-C5-methylase (TrmA/RlmC/RlmD family)
VDAGEPIELEITDVAHGGVFVGRHEGRVVFVPDTIPGERVRVRPGTGSEGKRFWRAELLEVLDSSPHRRRHVWRQADVDVPPQLRPGGADFGHIDLAHQRGLKLQVLMDALRRIGGMAEATASITAASPVLSDAGDVLAEETADGTRWRTRVSLHVDADGRVGPYAARSHRVIPVDDLPLATPDVEQAALSIPRGEPGRIDLVRPADGRVRVLHRPERRRAGPAARETIIERVDGREFRVDAGGFWQVHRLAAHSLTELVAGRLQGLRADGPIPRTGGASIDPDAWHLDLYGGVGLFAAAVAGLGGPGIRITTVESDPRATAHARENLADWAGARAETARVDRWLARLAQQASAAERDRLSRGVILLDPPRSGAGRAVVEHIAALAPQTVVYVACDPVALARDLATFHTLRYETRSVDAIDLFPNSHHVEAVAVLERG